MQGLTKWKQNVLPPLNWKRTWLKVAVCMCAAVCVCVCVCMCWHTNTSEGGGSFGSVSICSDPHPALFWLLFSSLLTSIALSCSPRAEDKQRSALNSQRLLSVFLFLSPHPPPTSCCFGKNKTTTKKECCFASQQKRLTNKRSIKYHNICFHLHI